MATIKQFDVSPCAFTVEFGPAYSERLAIPLIKLVPPGSRMTVTPHTWGFKNKAYLMPVIQAFVKTGNTVNVEQRPGVYVPYSPDFPKGKFVAQPAQNSGFVDLGQPVVINTAPPSSDNVNDYSTPVAVPFKAQPSPTPAPQTKTRVKKKTPLVLGKEGDILANLKIIIDEMGIFRTRLALLRQNGKVIGKMSFDAYMKYIGIIETKEKENDEKHNIKIKTNTKFSVLGLDEREDNQDAIKKAWVNRLHLVHPDKTNNSDNSNQATILVNEAYKFLKDSASRADYRRRLQISRKLKGVEPDEYLTITLPGFVSLEPRVVRSAAAFTLECDAVVNDDLSTFTVRYVHNITPVVVNGQIFVRELGWVNKSNYI